MGQQRQDQERPRHSPANGSEENEKLVSLLKTVLCDSFPSPFTDQLRFFLKKINDRIRELFSFYELSHRDVVLMKKDICAKGDSLFPIPALIPSSFDDINEKIKFFDRYKNSRIRGIEKETKSWLLH